jgi:alanyl-tRNA synthetase
MITSFQLRQQFLDFFASKGHAVIPSAPLVPENDPTTLFTGAGMQPMVPYLLGQPHPLGTRLVDSQKCFRSQDIEEVGDNRHDTFFEMLGNWSLGDYFKEEQISWLYEFLTKHLGLSKDKLWVSVFAGDEIIPRDDITASIWEKLGISKDKIHFYDENKNWWSRTGIKSNMPIGEPGGPDSEVFYDFGVERKLHEKSVYSDHPCHPNCDCGRFLEIGNSVFMTYQRTATGFEPLAKKNIDFGGGLERMIAAVNDDPDIFKTDLFKPIIDMLEKTSGSSYSDYPAEMRVIADHIKASVFLVKDGVRPSNKAQGYFLRRLLRRAVVKLQEITDNTDISGTFSEGIKSVINIYLDIYFKVDDFNAIESVISEEIVRFEKVISSASREVESINKVIDFISKNRFSGNISLLMSKMEKIRLYVIPKQQALIIKIIDIGNKYGIKSYYVNNELENLPRNPEFSGDDEKIFKDTIDELKKNPITLNSFWVFRIVSSFGMPLEILEEEAKERNIAIDIAGYYEEVAKHKKLSRTAGKGMFKGGLQDQSEITTKYHTATHLLHKALRIVLGDHVQQKGSNITSERLRFDFSHDAKLTPEQISQVEKIVNEKISADLPVTRQEMNKHQALSEGALAFFPEKYPEISSVYTIGPLDDWFSKELCGGPHVSSTGVIRGIKIIKEESAGAGIRRIYAKLPVAS